MTRFVIFDTGFVDLAAALNILVPIAAVAITTVGHHCSMMWLVIATISHIKS